MAYARADFYIMGAGSLFSNRKMAFLKTQNVLNDQRKFTVIVAKRHKVGWRDDNPTPIFITGCGNSMYGVDQPGEMTYTQDTGNGYRCDGYRLEVENVVHVDEQGQIVYKMNDVGIDDKRQMWVMK